MAALDQIMEMKNQGLQTNQIIQSLKQQGISPKEINEALSQSEIKSEISKDSNQNIFPGTPESNISPQQLGMQQPAGNPSGIQAPSSIAPQSSDGMQGMQPSLGESIQTPPAQEVPPQSPAETPGMEMQSPMEVPAPSAEAPPEYQGQEEYPEYSAGEYYPEYQYGQQSSDIDTIRDISSQITDEKTKEFRKEFSQFTNFKKDTEMQLETLAVKLDKVEKIMEELQLAIIKKVGEYGEDIKQISNEIKTTQDSFSKLANPLMDKREEEKTTTQKTETKKSPSRRKSKKSPTFEDFLR